MSGAAALSPAKKAVPSPTIKNMDRKRLGALNNLSERILEK